MSIVLNDKLRIQVVSDNTLRFEMSNGQFLDSPTFFIQNRRDLDLLTSIDDEDYHLRFQDLTIRIEKELNPLHLRIFKGNKLLYKFELKKNSGELPPVYKTPEIFPLFDNPRLILPLGGLTKENIKKGETYRIEEGVADFYLIYCKRDHKLLREEYTRLTGENKLLRLSAFGVFNSKYYEYNEKTALAVIDEYDKRDLPLDYLVIDTDWRRKGTNGTGYEVNHELFPDITRFLNACHKRKVSVMFNDHPCPVKGCQNAFCSDEIEFREDNLRALLRYGVDALWYDRNWWTSLISPTPSIDKETIGMYIYSTATSLEHENMHNDLRDDIMSNVDEIRNGTYLSIQNSASHRYGIQWTGDTGSDSFYFQQEVENLIRGSENCIPYLSSDIGGHWGNPDKSEYIRWIQFGALSPIFRPHCTKGLYRECYSYDDETVSIFRDYADMRYNLLPYFYALAYKCYKTGTPLCTSLSYFYRDKKCRQEKSAYLLGESIIIAPITDFGYRKIDDAKIHAVFYSGIDLDGEILLEKDYQTLDLHTKDTPFEEELPLYNYSARFHTSISFTEDVLFYLEADDGVRIYINGKLCYEDWSEHAKRMEGGIPLKRDVNYDLTIEYFQASGDAHLSMYVKSAMKSFNKRLYLPKGKWFDPYTDELLIGGKEHFGYYPLKNTPILVRAGSLIPLAKTSKRTEDQFWHELTLDFYPGRDCQFILYEDDTKTKAYERGEYREEIIKVHSSKCYHTLTFSTFHGRFKGDKCFPLRDWTLRIHEKVDSVKLNGRIVPHSTFKGERGCLPFSWDNAPADCSIVRFAQSFEQSVTIKVKRLK